MKAPAWDWLGPDVPLAAEQEAEEEQASRYRDEARAFRTEAMERYPDSPTEAKELERTAADLISLAASIERRHRGLPALPPVGLS